MKIELSGKQRRVLVESLKRGFLTLGDMYLMYSTEKARLSALERFKMAGLIEDSSIGTNRFKINKEKVKEAIGVMDEQSN